MEVPPNYLRIEKGLPKPGKRRAPWLGVWAGIWVAFGRTRIDHR